MRAKCFDRSTTRLGVRAITIRCACWRCCPRKPFSNAANDTEFLKIYDLVMDEFEASIESETGWFTSEYGKPQATMAYFSAEYAFHNSLKLYAGGLGVLAGDYIKECSDLAIPVVAVGLVYSRGYLSQKLRDDGWQEDEEKDIRSHTRSCTANSRQRQPASFGAGAFVRSAAPRAGVARGYWPGPGLFARYGRGRQSRR